jgi:SAM-dependent methyltransferase
MSRVRGELIVRDLSPRIPAGSPPDDQPDPCPGLRLDPSGHVRHDIRPEELSNDLAGWLADLVADGLLDPDAFEETFVRIVEEIDPGWTAFYRNTLVALADGGEEGGTNAGMAPVHDRAAALAVGPHVVELGCCFGFLSLRLAAEGHRVTAVDLVAGTARLLAGVAATLGSSVGALAGDARRIPLADASADTVFAVHLLEHLPPGDDVAVLAEMLRVARRRTVVAVPFEDVPNPTWGHVRTFDLADLDALGAATGLPYSVEEHHGGWLVVDASDRPDVPWTQVVRTAPKVPSGGPPRPAVGTQPADVPHAGNGAGAPSATGISAGAAAVPTAGVHPMSTTSTAPTAESAAAPSAVTSNPCSSSAGGAEGTASTAARVTPSADPT